MKHSKIEFPIAEIESALEWKNIMIGHKEEDVKIILRAVHPVSFQPQLIVGIDREDKLRGMEFYRVTLEFVHDTKNG